jgi:DNA-binding GntR family transcriptional regulator
MQQFRAVKLEMTMAERDGEPEAPGNQPEGRGNAPERPETDDAPRKGHLFGSTAEAIRKLILDGVLPPGHRLKERELCEQLGVSRTPVREAIKALTQEGLLRSLPNHSAVVATMDLDEVRALVVVLAEIEALSVRLACAAASDADLEKIAAAHHQMVIFQVRNLLHEYFHYNKEFHRLIATASGNSVLLWNWQLLATRSDRARFTSNLRPKRWPLAIQEHAGILEALIARDGERASQLMREHVRNGLLGVIAALEQQETLSVKRPEAASPA